LTESNQMIHNPGSLASEPIISIYGEGDIELRINEKIVHLYDVENKVIINSEMMDCYSSDMMNLNRKMKGNFPLFEVGQNSVHWIGDIEKVEIVPNWRWL